MAEAAQGRSNAAPSASPTQGQRPGRFILNRFLLPGSPCVYGALQGPWTGDIGTDLLWISADGTAPACSPDGAADPQAFPCLVLRPVASASRPSSPAGSPRVTMEDPGRPVVLVLHGTGEDLGGSYESLSALRNSLGTIVACPEYPGYGPRASRHGAHEPGVNARARSALTFVTDVLGCPPTA
eukprot:TRINITY_DN16954_c0_g1_i3.p2 TRINITY_DN16954_c0_g1~~TRINITY_DN16954_c0_g1_i3.p2  ORF type:complete len:183 (+),score=9.99 TRINITY_DN16954_c0_g1_i3:80-628(+)